MTNLFLCQYSMPSAQWSSLMRRTKTICIGVKIERTETQPCQRNQQSDLHHMVRIPLEAVRLSHSLVK